MTLFPGSFKSAARLATAIVSFLIGILLIAGGSITAASASTSSWTVSCTGFSACAKKHYSDKGYAKVYKQSFWGSRAGHNCTNWVAYRLTHLGRVTNRPFALGNASDWGTNAKRFGIPVTKTPKVGDVAWFSYRTGNSVRSHVAMVEKVLSGSRVLISEDGATGGFRYSVVSNRRVSGFIRFPQSDGSPYGKVTAAKNDKGTVTTAWSSGEADTKNGAHSVTLSWNGPLDAPGTTKATYNLRSTGNWRILRTSSTPPTSVYVYGNNAPGTRGKNTLIGRMAVTPGKYVPPVTQWSTKTSMSIADTSIKTKNRAVLKVKVARVSTSQPYPGGYVWVLDGKKHIKTVIYGSYSIHGMKITLPKLKKGKHRISVKYIGNGTHRTSTSTGRTVTIR